MENIITTTSPVLTVPGDARAFGMPMRGCAFGTQWIPTTGLSLVATPESVVRDRKDLAAQGQVALAVYVPGFPAWSPSLC